MMAMQQMPRGFRVLATAAEHTPRLRSGAAPRSTDRYARESVHHGHADLPPTDVMCIVIVP